MNNPSDSHAPERTSGIDRFYVFGAKDSASTEELVAGIFRKSFEEQKFGETETEKPAECAAVINAVLPRISEFVRSFGGNPLPLTAEHFHFYDNDKIPRDISAQFVGKELSLGGVYRPDEQDVCILWQHAEGSLLNIAHAVVHEAMYFNSFGSYRVTHKGVIGGKEQLIIQPVGLGLTWNKGDSIPFWGLNEAVTEELAKRFDAFLLDIPELQEEIRLREECKKTLPEEYSGWADELMSPPRAKVVVETLEMRMVRTDYRLYSYYQERTELYKLLQLLYEKNKNVFSSPDDAFALLAEAYFTGYKYDIAHAVDTAYGSFGFRRLGNETGRSLSKDNLQ